MLRSVGGLSSRVLFAGVVDGRNVWANDFEANLHQLGQLEAGRGGCGVHVVLTAPRAPQPRSRTGAGRRGPTLAGLGRGEAGRALRPGSSGSGGSGSGVVGRAAMGRGATTLASTLPWRPTWRPTWWPTGRLTGLDERQRGSWTRTSDCGLRPSATSIPGARRHSPSESTYNEPSWRCPDSPRPPSVRSHRRRLSDPSEPAGGPDGWMTPRTSRPCETRSIGWSPSKRRSAWTCSSMGSPSATTWCATSPGS